LNRISKRAAVLLTAASLLISSLGACTLQPASDAPDVTEDVQPTSTAPEVRTADKVFTVRYDARYSFNPITGTNPDNMALVPLMYEPLFMLDEYMTPQPVLCESYETRDGIHYTFRLKPNIAMTDGTTLNANDVKYTLTKAAQTGRYTGRLGNIESITASGTLEFNITLKTPNYKLPALLDIPIIKTGGIDKNYPAGSGPYYFEPSGAPRLIAFSSYRENVPTQTIYLRQCTNTELSVLFSSQAIDLFWDDPADTADITILSDHEVRYYNTTILQFVGFNVKRKVLSDPGMRRALGLTIDRKDITSGVYSAHADAAPLILSPKYPLYDTSWENAVTDTLDEISAIFAELDLQDKDSDGFLEYPDANGNHVPFSLKFIVNGDNKYKVAAAEKITAGMKAVGIDVTLSMLPWDEYKSALEKGNFDLYYGDVFLPADYDLSALLAPGGSIDYGNAGNAEYSARIRAFLAAPDPEKEAAAAKELCLYVQERAPIIPVLYRQYAVHTNRNIVTGINPTQSSVFYGLSGWRISFD
jgi:peptide/nickel transport system substrate-binding protein